MKKYTFLLALTGLLTAGTVTTALACEGGKSKMEQIDKKKKSKKDKKAAATESCHAPAAKETATSEAAAKACRSQRKLVLFQ